MRAQRPQRPSLDTSFSSLSLETSKESSSAYKPQRDRADSAASHSSSSAFATPPEGHSPRHSLIPTTNSTSSAATATQENFDGPFKSDDTINLTHSPRSLHTRTASVGSPPLHEIVKAKYDYVPDHPSGLPFYAGQLIQVHYKDPSGWWDGEVANVRGWFPSNYLFPDSSKLVRASSQVSPGHSSSALHTPSFFFLSCQSPLRHRHALAMLPPSKQCRHVPGNGTVNQDCGSVILDGNLPSVPFQTNFNFCRIIA
jgi:SH3 domain